ncbi:hypothetical protein [Puniceicoccus vermicola]|uniref:Sulfatase N-terminal domain-containing protein n=1 Tax=Puniceicoccus vermicola TaxID=388746 RepID=A0A7X1E524_9BACT|nr:hypothetical protein [Puniceicoccus vermicola]MBC2603200.1 hypothetical protein [Puniceicoccus vermicola]
MKKKPNILLFLSDDELLDTIPALGTKQIHSPTLDSLAVRGTTFTHADIP